MHAGIEIGFLPLVQFTLNGHYNFSFNEYAFFNQRSLGRAEEKFGVSLHFSSHALHQSNFALLQSLTPYAGISYNPYARNINIQNDSIRERWDAIIGIDFSILKSIHVSIHSNIIQGVTADFQKSLYLQFYVGPNMLGSKMPERYVVNKASQYLHSLSIRTAQYFEEAATREREANTARERRARVSAALRRFEQGERGIMI